MSQMKVSIIAGGAGFIGCNLLPMLANEGRQLMVLDNLCRGRLEYLTSAIEVAPGRVHFMNINLAE
jgi:UDP-glucose 4-epimerase